MITVVGKLKIARGTTAERIAVTLEEGEPCWDTDQNRLYVGDGATAGGVAAQVFSIGVACSDETTAITTGAAKVTFRAPCALTVVAVRAGLSTAQTGSGAGGIVTVDINEAGVSILSTKLTIDNGEKTSVSASTPAVVSDAAIADDAEITIDIDQIGDGTAKGLKVWIMYTPKS